MILDFLRKRQDPHKDLKEILKGYELPSFPAAVMNVLNLLRHPDSPMKKIAELIKSDPGMHVKVLKTVNSAAFGLSRKVDNVLHAASLLGRSRLESLVLPLGVKAAIPATTCASFDPGTFWLTAARRACLADRVAGLIHPATRLESFTAGLLQDMAIPVLIDVKRRDYCDTLERWNRQPEKHLDQMEQESHGIDHQTVGALMASEWNLPEYLVKAIRLHHAGDDETESTEPAIRLVSSLHYAGRNEESRLEEIAAGLLVSRLGMSSEQAAQTIREAFNSAREFTSIIN